MIANAVLFIALYTIDEFKLAFFFITCKKIEVLIINRYHVTSTNFFFLWFFVNLGFSESLCGVLTQISLAALSHTVFQ